MAFPIVLWRNRIGEALLTSPGAWQAPLDNLKTDFVTEVARTAGLDPEDTCFDMELRQRRPVRAIVAINTNCTTLATYEVQAATAPSFAPGTLLYESGSREVYRRLHSWQDLRWGDPNFWFGKPAAEDLEGFTRYIIHVLPQTVDARYWRLKISDQFNPAGFLDLGRVFIGGGSQASQGYARGSTLGYETATRKSRSRGGVPFFRRSEAFRVQTFSLPWLPAQEGFERWLEIQRQMGLDGELFVIPDADDEINLTRRCFRGRLRNMQPLEQVGTGFASIAFEIEEG